jgi:hypothetical protein
MSRNSKEHPYSTTKMLRLPMTSSIPLLTNSIHAEQGFTLSKLTSRKLHNDIMSCKFDRDGELLALGLKNGTRVIYSVNERRFRPMQRSS